MLPSGLLKREEASEIERARFAMIELLYGWQQRRCSSHHTHTNQAFKAHQRKLPVLRRDGATQLSNLQTTASQIRKRLRLARKGEIAGACFGIGNPLDSLEHGRKQEVK